MPDQIRLVKPTKRRRRPGSDIITLNFNNKNFFCSDLKI